LSFWDWLFHRRRRDEELDEEVQAHLRMATQERMEQGETAEQARASAVREFGNVTLVKEVTREMWGWGFWETCSQDVRYSLRQLKRNPGFTTVAVLTLALGIGANTAIFSVVNAVLLRPLPYRQPGQLVMVWEQLPALGLDSFASPLANYFDYQSQNRVFEDIAAIENAHFDLNAGDQPERIFGMRASANLFPLLGVAPTLGRAFTLDENKPGHANVALLSDSLWQRRFGADRSIIGKTISLDGNLFTVVGVMPRDFRFSVGLPELPQVWLPVAFQADPDRSIGRLQLMARLKPGVSLEQARTEMKTIAGRLEQQYHLYRGPHGEDAGYTVAVFPLRQEITGDLHSILLVMLGAVGLVLVIACVNMANLLLARAATREKEFAVRAALGAGRARLARQLLTEGVTLALIGGGLGLLLAFRGLAPLVALSPYDTLRVLGVGIDGRVLGFTLVVSLLTGVLFTLAPALQGSRVDLSSSLKQGAAVGAMIAFRSRFRQALVVAEVALSLVLLVGAGLLIRSFAALQSVKPGFQPEKVMTTRLSLPTTEYSDDSKVSAFFGRLLERVAALPGVTSAGAISSLPIAGGASRDPFSIEGRSWKEADPSTGTPQVASFEVISPGYFHTLQIPLLDGRDFSASDTHGALPVAIINATLARGFWPDESPLGKHIVLGASRPGVPWLTIVGVAGDVRNGGLETKPWPQIYVPQMQSPSPSMTLVIRTAIDAGGLASVVQREVMALDKNRPVYGTATLDQLLADTVAPRRYNMLLLGTLAALALGLAAIGIYGVTSFWVTRRTHEFGIRLALGADRHDVVAMVVGEGMILALVGVAIGLCGAWFLARIVASLLYGVRPVDPPTFLATALLQSGVAWLACYLPARRATKVDPMVALRYE
jgi:putative ABC transport system permease protein